MCFAVVPRTSILRILLLSYDNIRNGNGVPQENGIASAGRKTAKIIVLSNKLPRKIC